MKRRTQLAAATLAALLFLLPTSASSTTFVMPTDEQLVAASPVIVMGRVISREPAPTSGAPATDHWIDVERPLKGFVPASALLVRIAGGVGSDGIGKHTFGAPVLVPGQRVILFLAPPSLAPNGAGAYRVMNLALGAFFEAGTGEKRYAVRQLEEVSEIRLPGDPIAAQRAQARLPRNFDGFADWIAARAAGRTADVDYFEADGATLGVEAGFNTTQSPTSGPPFGCTEAFGGNHVRWTEFDTGEPVVFFAHEDGQVGVPGGGFAEFEAALGIWNADAESRAGFVYGGTTDATTGATALDGINSALFEDQNDEIPGMFNGFGIVGQATVFFACEVLHTFFGGIAHNLIEADIITQDGAGSFFFGVAANPALPAGEIFGHEVGHTAGLAHPCGDPSTGDCAGDQNDALMRAFVHNDDRGAVLGVDDRAGIRFLYGLGVEDGAPAAPSDLSATAISTDSIQLTWTDNSAVEDFFDIEVRTSTGSFAVNPTTSVGADTTSATISTADLAAVEEELGDGTYLVFRVRARNAIGSSPFSNEAAATTLGIVGPCLADETTLCLNDDRFRVRVRWATVLGATGNGMADPITGDTGTFWFFSAANIELVVKVLDACGFNQHFWVFAGGLTNVLVEITVVDTATGASRTFINPQQTEFDPVQQTDAFATCT